MKSFVNSDLALSVSADVGVDGFLDFLKSNGLKAGKKPVAELLEGKRDEVAGFYLVDLEGDEAPVVDAPAPTAGDADEKPAFDDNAVKAAEAEFLANGGAVTTEKPKADEPAAPKKARAEKVLKAVAPKGKIKPVRKGTKIANGLEALLKGATAADLAAYSDDIVDFCNRRVTKRGYGIALDGETIRLVLPEGVTAVTYSG